MFILFFEKFDVEILTINEKRCVIARVRVLITVVQIT